MAISKKDTKPDEPELVDPTVPQVDETGKYDHTGPYPTPAHPTPPNPDTGETQADLDAEQARVADGR